MYLLAKIHKSKFIEDMYSKEYLYFSSLKSFRGKSKDNGRTDPKEGNLKNIQISYLSLGEGKDKIELNKILSNFSAQYTENLADSKYNCCSLYKLDLEIGMPSPTLHTEMFSMGEEALLIYEPLKFYTILDTAIENKGYEYSRKPVTYYNPKEYDGDLTLHHKNHEFNYQKEYRILIVPTDNKPIKIHLPGLKNISTIVKTETLNGLKIEHG